MAGGREQQGWGRLVTLSDPDIEIVCPRGSSHGSHVLAEWLERAGLTLTTLRVFAQGSAVVVKQHGVWRSPATSEITGDRIVASSLQVKNGRVARYARFDDLDTALRGAGLAPADDLAAS